MVANMDSSSTTSSTCADDKKRTSIVSFALRCSVRPTISRVDYSADEINAAWYTQSEYNAIQMSCIKQVQKLDQGHFLKGIKYSARGLEGHTRIGSIQKQLNRKQSINAVLDEQDRQEFHLLVNSIDDIALSQAYQRYSSSCQLFAHSMALIDQKEVAEYAYFMEPRSSSPPVAAATTDVMVVVDNKAAADESVSTKIDDTMYLLQQHIRGAVANSSNKVKTIHRYAARSA